MRLVPAAGETLAGGGRDSDRPHLEADRLQRPLRLSGRRSGGEDVVAHDHPRPGSSYGEGWVLIKGNDWFVGENTGRNSPDDGYATNGSVTGWGKYNVFARNSASNTADYGLWIHLPNNVDLRNKVSCNNSTSSTSDGAMNVTCMK